MDHRVKVAKLAVASALYDFIETEALPGSGVTAGEFWSGLATLIHELAPLNRQFLDLRNELQARIDDFHRVNVGAPVDPVAYERFLRKIGYLLPEPADFAIRTTNLDDEIATIAGPQLVVPLSNARYALNAANARWGSLYDALYGTDAIAEDDGAARGFELCKSQLIPGTSNTLRLTCCGPRHRSAQQRGSQEQPLREIGDGQEDRGE